MTNKNAETAETISTLAESYQVLFNANRQLADYSVSEVLEAIKRLAKTIQPEVKDA